MISKKGEIKMVDIDRIAIADLLKHPKLGIVSHQPILKGEYKTSDDITVRDVNFKQYTVLASECEWPTEDDEEANNYWKNITRER